MNIYVGNLPRATSEVELKQMFEAYGQVTAASIIKDKETKESRGFGFVEMPDKAEAEAAMKALHNKEFEGRTLTVNEARPKEDRGGGFRGGNGGPKRNSFQRDRDRRSRGSGKRY